MADDNIYNQFSRGSLRHCYTKPSKQHYKYQCQVFQPCQDGFQSLSFGSEILTFQVCDVWSNDLARFDSNFVEEYARGDQGTPTSLPLPPTSREDLQLDGYLKRRFVEWAQNEIAVVPDFHKRILFSDEAHFWLNGYVNKQNCRIWSETNPQVYVEALLHPEKLTVWCALWAGKIIGPYFFKNDEGHNVTVNGDRYRAMITNFFIPELNNHDVQELWFQQDGSKCHTARATIYLLKDTFVFA
ncbi:putative DD41D transposase [Trichonephila clavipes]|nr:putative DD41D transposase [Trichonephila clavipes]